jgi:probable phosphoglycerate mutase
MHQATQITAVRHGETAWNAESRLQGHLDIDLNDLGRWQAQRVGLALADSGISTIYCSDLCRAHNTALAISRAISQHSGIAPSDLRLEPGLRERSFGSFEGLTYEQVSTLHPEDALRWKQRDPHWAPPGGESPTALHQRIATTLHAIAAQHPGEHIALVSHGGVLDMLYRLATGQVLNAPRTWELGNCAINRLLYTPQALTLVGWADTQHLDAQAMDEGSA